MKVALVEDNHALRSSLADFLSIKGHEVREVGEAIGFYQLLGTEKFDVAIIDINLPDYDGFSITRYLSSKQLCAVIITSARDTLEDRVKGYGAGADIYMTKPVDPEELAAAIEMIGRRFRSVQEKGKGSDADSCWRLDLLRRFLWGPNGRLVPLTRREAALMHVFARQDGVMVSREEIEAILGEVGGNGRGWLDTALSRLRNKVRDKTEIEFPLVTNRAQGFSFLASIEFM